MKILYEWITKPYIKWNFIDNIICIVEIFLLAFICFRIYFLIDEAKKRRKK